MIHTSNGKSFVSTEGETVPDAALRANVTLPYRCRTGRCSTGKGQVRAVTTTALHDEIGLSQPKRDAGCILTCVRSATSDVKLEVENLGDVQLFPAKTPSCRIQQPMTTAGTALWPDVMGSSTGRASID